MSRIYVDSIQKSRQTKRWPYNFACHLFVDPQTDLEKLHNFARSIGMKRHWFQHKSEMPHYDLTVNMRIKAVARGAVEVSIRDAVAFLRLWREERKLKR